MDAWIALARGPLFRVSLVVCVLGLALRFLGELYHVVTAWRRAGDRSLPLATVVRATVGWLLPVRLLRTRPVYAALSFVFHAGLILLPLFLAGHVALWQQDIHVPWPTFTPGVADALTVVAAAGMLGVLLARASSAAARALTGLQDVAVLLVLLLLTLTGAHPLLSPLDARFMLLSHVLLGDLALLLTPTTKIVHCVLAPLSQLVFELGWHFPADTGRHVAVVLRKEDEPV
jgi:nitrate reductase gamma subunit